VLWQKIYERSDVGLILVANFLVASILSPFLCDIVISAFGLPMSFRVCLFISGFVAIFGPWIFIVAIPWVFNRLSRLWDGESGN